MRRTTALAGVALAISAPAAAEPIAVVIDHDEMVLGGERLAMVVHHDAAVTGGRADAPLAVAGFTSLCGGAQDWTTAGCASADDASPWMSAASEAAGPQTLLPESAARRASPITLAVFTFDDPPTLRRGQPAFTLRPMRASFKLPF